MILVDHGESYQNIPKSPHIALKKVPLLWGQSLGSQGKPSKKNLCNTTRQGLSESLSYELT
jgi:hypothetical protein